MTDEDDGLGLVDEEWWFLNAPRAANLPAMLTQMCDLDEAMVAGMRRAFSRDYVRLVRALPALRAMFEHFGTSREATVGVYMNTALNVGTDNIPEFDIERMFAITIVMLARLMVLKNVSRFDD